MDSKAPESEGKQIQSTLEDLALVNELQYDVVPKSLTLRKNVVLTDNPAQQSAYDQINNRILVRLQTNHMSVDGPSSFLTFNLIVAGTLDVNATRFSFGEGSAMNLIEQVIYRSRDGVEISNNRTKNLVHHQKTRYQRSDAWHRTQGSVMGFTNGVEAEEKALTADAIAGGAQICIPMSELLGIWEEQQLLPSSLVAGSQVEIVLNKDLASAFRLVGNGAAINGYQVSRPVIKTQCVELADSIQSYLSDVASTSGLTMLFKDYDSNHAVFQGGTSQQIQVRRNIANLTKTYIRSRNTDDIVDEGKDSYASRPSPDGFSWQVRIGPTYHPASRVSNVSESYMFSLNAMEKFKSHNQEPDVSRLQYATDRGSIIHCTEKDSNLSLSGQSISNSRLYEFNSQETNPFAAAVRIDLAYEYVVKLTVFLTNVVSQY